MRDELIDRIAEAIHSRDIAPHALIRPWVGGHCDDAWHNLYRDMAKAALDAMKAHGRQETL